MTARRGRVAFAGTPSFAARALDAIVASGCEVPLVVTRPDRRAGRGMRLAESEVAQSAKRHRLIVVKPATLRTEEAVDAIRQAAPDVMVVAAFGMILPANVLAIPAAGCINIHASLLPRWRGAAPIQRAILAGDAQTGITIMRMDQGLDTGPALLQRSLALEGRETTGSLTEALARLGAQCIVEALDTLDTLAAHAQDEAAVTYASKVEKAEARIDWARSAAHIDRQVRAFNPSPGSETALAGELIKIWEAEPVPVRGEPGVVLEASTSGIVVGCGDGALRVLVLQRAGSKRLAAGAFLAGCALSPGTNLGSFGAEVAAKTPDSP